MGKSYTDYTIADLKRLQLSFLVKEASTAQGQKDAFLYLNQMAYSSGIFIDAINLLEVFGDGSKPLMVTDKGEINKRLFQYKAAMPEPTDNFGLAKLELL